MIVSTATASIMASAAGVAPQNINFAIKAVIPKNFLDASGMKTDGETQTKQVFEFADLAERAKLSTVKILGEYHTNPGDDLLSIKKLLSIFAVTALCIPVPQSPVLAQNGDGALAARLIGAALGPRS